MRRTARFGSWLSPITAEIAARAAISFSGLAWDKGDLYWVENHPSEGGRSALFRRSASRTASELTPPGFNVRSTVHEYGGGAFEVGDGLVFFVNASDQRVYKQSLDGAPIPITPDSGHRYADLTIDRHRRRLLCVQEDHSLPGEPANTIAAIRMDGSGCHVLVSGNDFYSNPRLSPGGDQLAYLTWNHPSMPWDGCELHVANVRADGSVATGHRVAGGLDESIFQPAWSPGGVLHFVSDRTGWWNLYQWTDHGARAVCSLPLEFGRALWSFGTSTYDFASENRILCCYTDRGLDHLAWLDTPTGNLQRITSPYTKLDFLRCGPKKAAFVGGAPGLPSTVVELDLGSSRLKPVRPAFSLDFEPAYLSLPEPLEWTTNDSRRSHGFYYAPTNPGFAAPDSERPPLMVLCHSGPTSSASTALRYALQFWTSRGFAVLDVNYTGSTGYGKAYRRGLNGQWGVRDVEDCCSGAIHLAKETAVHQSRMAIRGGSAGGFTALACLTSRNEVFAAGSAYYPITDLELLTKGSHKFESRYQRTLIGPYPERRDLYIARSPIHHVGALRCPLILFHGEDDRVVPPVQSQLMFDALRLNGQPTALLLFSGEGHGFRRADTLKRALEAELYFFSRIFAFRATGSVEPVPIENLTLAT